MIFRKRKISYPIFNIFILPFCFITTLSAQKNNTSVSPVVAKNILNRQDSVAKKNKNVVIAEPDTNFTWEKYATFLKKISDTSKYIVLPLNEFRQTLSSKKIVIGLRHDVDNDLNAAFQFSQVEYNLGFRSTYFILHTAPYYLENSNNMASHTEKIIPILKRMQNERNFEIGWHNDLVTLQVVYNINPVTFFHEELRWLRSNGLKIYGTAAHGSNYCKTLHYMNFYFFEECTYPIVPNRENNITVKNEGKLYTLIKGKLGDFDLKYEAYFLNNNKAYSDATITNGIRWNIGMLNLNKLEPGDRVIVLLHPIHWHKASINANIVSFSFEGQKSCSIDTINSIVSVVMPYMAKRDSLIPVFRLSPGAFAKINGRLQISRISRNNFNNPLICKVYAENRDIQKEWTIDVNIEKNSTCDFLSFKVPDMIKPVSINTTQKTILAEVNEHTDLKHLFFSFNVSQGASVWNGKNRVFSNTGTINFSGKVQLRVLSEDGINSCIWTVTVKRVKT
jgi:hypothetical protein